MVTSGLKRLLSHLPVNPTSAPNLYTEVLSHAGTAWCAERTIQPWYCRHDAIERFKKDHPEFIFLPMDKNESRGMQRSRAWCGTPPILGVVNMVGTRNFTCYMGAL